MAARSSSAKWPASAIRCPRAATPRPNAARFDGASSRGSGWAAATKPLVADVAPKVRLGRRPARIDQRAERRTLEWQVLAIKKGQDAHVRAPPRAVPAAIMATIRARPQGGSAVLGTRAATRGPQRRLSS